VGLSIVDKQEGDNYDPDCAVLEITLCCNFRCIHCGGSAGAKRDKELTVNEVNTIAGDLKRIGFKRVSLIGGEPFLRQEWFEIANTIRDHGLLLTYVTNGSLFPGNPKLVDLVLETKPQVMGFSLDGGTAETHDHIRDYKGSFDKVQQSISIFKDKGVDVSIITAVNRLNVGELPRIRDLILGKGIAWQVQICSHNGSRFPKELFITKEEYLQTAAFIHECATKYSLAELPIAGADDIGYFSNKFPLCSINRHCWQGCKAGMSNLGIQSNGNVKGCDSLPDIYVEGNIRTRSLFEIWNSPDSFRYTRKFDTSLLKGSCSQCKHGAVCKGGCVDIAHTISGHPFENSYCLYLNEMTEEPVHSVEN
jgi:radical SAM protein with 4Fe4S-binding SPASM domain